MITLKPLTTLAAADLERIGPYYQSDQRYAVTRTETPEHFSISLDLISLDTPYRKGFMRGAGLIDYYQDMLAAGYSVGAYDGAYDGAHMVGLAIAYPEDWNRTLTLWEFHVEQRWRGQGIGRQMMAHIIARARAARLRVITLETSVSNVPAIRFYRRLGFAIDAVDLSYYSNDDLALGDVAIFMKYKLA